MAITKEKIYSNELYDSLSEIDTILEYMKITSVFPEKFIKFIKENKNKNYYFKYDETLTLNEQNVTSTTKQILAVLYSEYFCSAEQKEKLEKIWKENDKIYIEQTQIDTEERVNIQSNSIVKYSEPLFKKLLNKIKGFFKRIF